MYKWYWADEPLTAPEKFIAGAELIKKNPVRRVYYRDGYFFKEERPNTLWRTVRNFFRSKSGSEFRSILALKRVNVPVVHAVGYGKSAGNSILVTREFAGGVSVKDYWCREFVREGKEPSEFLRNYAQFLKKIFSSEIFHPDFHVGNILYAPERKEFALVDVYGVRQRRRMTVKCFMRMARIITELRDVLDTPQLEEFAIECGLAEKAEEAQVLCRVLLDAERKRLEHEMPKRFGQLWCDYYKFIRKVNYNGQTLRLLLDSAGEPWIEPEELDDSEAIWLSAAELRSSVQNSFEKSLRLEKHNRIVAFDKANNIIYRRKEK